MPVAWQHLTRREAVPEASSYALDLAEIRALAGRMEGPRPLWVRSELVGESHDTDQRRRLIRDGVIGAGFES